MQGAVPINAHDLLRGGAVEIDRLELKASLQPFDEDRIARTLCAFANDLHNRNGGYLLIGVAEAAGDQPARAIGLTDAECDRVQKRLVELGHKVTPPVTPVLDVQEVGGHRIVIARCPAGPDRPYRYQRKPYVRVGSITQEAKGPLERQLLEISVRIPFDARPSAWLATDLNPTSIYAFLDKADPKRRIDRSKGVEDILGRLWLLDQTNGRRPVKHAAVLFFADRPDELLPGARIEASFHPRGRGGPTMVEQMFTGPLHHQVRDALAWIAVHDDTLITKVSERPEAQRVSAWPAEAIEEALVNAVLHRGYAPQWPDPTKVVIEPDALRIVSYPGPVPGVTLQALQAGEPEIVAARNRHLAELLKALDLAEVKSSGIAHIHEAMRANGNPPPTFRFDEDRSYFEVVLPVHPSVVAARRQQSRIGWRALHRRPAPPDRLMGRSGLLSMIERRLTIDPCIELCGMPGVGKTSLMQALVARAAAWRPAAYVDLAQFRHGGLTGLKESLGVDPDHGSISAALAAWAQGARGLLAVDAADVLAAGSEPTADAVLEMLERGSEHADLVVTADFSTLNSDIALPVPPLGAADASELARAVARSDLSDATIGAIVDLSGGVPGLIVELARRLEIAPNPGPEAVQSAFDHLEIADGDPWGIARLRAGLRTGMEWRPSIALTLYHFGPLPRAALIARLTSEGEGRIEVVRAIRDAELASHIAEVDGMMRPVLPYLVR